MQNLFEYVILHHAKKKGDEPSKTTLVKDIQRVIAGTESEVTMLAARAIPDEFLDKLSEVEIKVRPF